MFRSSSLRASLTTALMLSIFAILAGGSLVFWMYARYSAQQSADGLLAGALRHLELDLPSAGKGDAAELVEEVRDLSSEGIAAIVIDASGRTIQRSAGRVPLAPFRSDSAWRVRTARRGELLLVVAIPWARADAMLRFEAAALAMTTLIGTAIGALGGWLLVGRTLAPIGALADHAREISTDLQTARIIEPSADAEIRILVTTLNEMLDRLRSSANARSRFHAAASHELRTPLQALSGHLELSLSRERSSEERFATIREAYLQTQRLSRLVCDLLTLQRLDTEAQRAVEPVPLGLACEQAVDLARPMAASRGLELHVATAQASVVTAPRTHVETILRNVVNNAVAYARPGGVVRITAEARRALIQNEVAVADGRDTAASQSPSEQVNSPGASYGLGLAICQGLAETNGWRMALQWEEAQVTCTIDFA